MDGRRTRRAGRAAIVAVIVVCAGSLAASAQACTKVWTTPADGAWSDAGAWSPPGVPATSDDVCLPATATFTVTLAGSATVASIAVGGAGVGAQTLVITTAPGGSSAPSSTLTATGGGSIAANGTLALETVVAGAAGPGGQPAGGSAILAGGLLRNDGTITSRVDQPVPGTVLASRPAAYLRAPVVNEPTGAVRIESGILAMDAGTTFENLGSVSAAAGQWLVTTAPPLSSTPTRVVNAGTVAAGSVQLVDAAWTQAGGSVTGGVSIGLAGSALDYESGTGSFLFTPGGAASDSTLSGTIPAGQTVALSGAVLRLAGPVVNRGKLTIRRLGTLIGSRLDNRGELTVNAGDAYLRTDLVNEPDGYIGLLSGSLFQDVGTTTVNSGMLVIALAQTYSLGAGPASRSTLRNTARGTIAVQVDPPSLGIIRLEHGGRLVAGGTLRAARRYGYSPAAGSSDRIVVGAPGRRSGRFARIAGGTTLRYGVDSSISIIYPGRQ